MKRFSHLSPNLLQATLLLLVGCGGSSPTAPNPGDDDNQKPASLTIQAGNNQSATVKAAVAISPTVAVLNAKGAGVSGVVVSFKVESGGGQVSPASVTTGADGRAAVTTWVLGSVVGTQQLSASTSGLPKVTFTATATGPSDPPPGGGGTPLTSGTLGSTGGTITVSKDGSGLNGVSLSFDQGALSGSTTLSLSEQPSTGIIFPAGITAQGPVLGVSGGGARLQAGAAVSFPIGTAPAGGILAVGFVDPSSGKLIILPTLSQKGGRLKALLPGLEAGPGVTTSSASQLFGSLKVGGKSRVATRSSLASLSPVALLSSANQTNPSFNLLLVGISTELLQRDLDSGFRPGTDAWDFSSMIVADLPFLRRVTAENGQQAGVAELGLTTTTLWYYVNQRKNGSPGLNGSTQLLQGQPLSSRYGIRWAAIAETDVTRIAQAGSLVIKEYSELETDQAAAVRWQQFLGLKAMMLTTFQRPVPVALLPTGSISDFGSDIFPVGIAYRTVGNSVFVTWPGNPGQEVEFKFSEAGGMQPVTLTYASSGKTFTVGSLGAMNYINLIDDSKMQAQWARVQGGTMGDAEGWPEPTLNWEKGVLDTAGTFISDPLQIWWQCPSCAEKVARPPQLPSTATHVQRFQSIDIPTDGSEGLTTSFSSAQVTATTLFAGGKQKVRKGFLIQHPVAEGTAGQVALGWLDWQTVVFKKLSLSPAPASVVVLKDSTVTITLHPSESPPSGTRYRWITRTSSTIDSVEATQLSRQFELRSTDIGWLVIRALDGSTKRPIASDSVKLLGYHGTAWRIVTVNDSHGLAGALSHRGSLEGASALQRLLQNPTAGLISLDSLAGSSHLQIRVKRSGSWSEADCCPRPPFNSGAEDLLPLGEDPAKSYQVGPFFSGWESAYWTRFVPSNQPDLWAMSGVGLTGPIQYTVRNGGTQQGPAIGLRFNSETLGANMTGWINVYLALKNGDDEVYILDAYTVYFTAVRLE